MGINPRISSIDLFKAFAIMLITGYHVWLYVGSPVLIYGIWNLYGPLIKPVGVAIFVFISGYLTHSMMTTFSYKNFFIKRFKRLLIPYYIAILFWYLLRLDNPAGEWSFLNILAHLLFIHNLHPISFYSISGVFWYMGLQMQLYVLYLLVRPFIKHHALLVGVISFLVFIVSGSISYNFIDISVWRIVVDKSVLSYGFVFLMGVIIKDRIDFIRPYLQKKYVVPLLGITAVAWMFYNYYLTSYHEVEKIIVGILLGLVMLGMPKINERNIFLRPFMLIGRASYSIFLYNFIIYVFQPLALDFKGLIIYSMFIFLFGIGAYYLIERPLIKRWAIENR